MRTLRLGGSTLGVVAAHLLAWQLAVGGLPRHALARPGVRWITAVRAAPATLAGHPAAVEKSIPTTVPKAARPENGFSKGTRAIARTVARPQVRAPVESPTVAARPSHGTPLAQLPTGARGSVASAMPDAPAWPVYPTRPSPSITLRYALEQSNGGASSTARGSAELEWTHDATSFTLSLATRPADRPPRQWRSEGTFDAAGVAPIRLAERERGRDKRAINFDRDGHRVRFSGTAQVLPLAPGAQDRWSWIAQLAAIAEAASDAGAHAIPAGTVWEIQVAGMRGELDRWVFRVLPDATPPALHLRRDPERAYDLLVEAWLSPALHYLPAGLRMSTPPGSWSMALWLDDDAPETPADGT